MNACNFRSTRLACILGLLALGTTASNAQNNGLPENVDPNAPPLAVATVRGTGEQIPYDIIDGMAIIEGDIILGSHRDVQASGIEPLTLTPAANRSSITAISSRHWPGGIVPFTLRAGTSSAAADAISDAIDEWESKTSVRFVQRTNETNYVEFVGTGNGNTCSSLLGRNGGRQPINYSGTGRGCLVHEIGHAMGLNHEQNRSDRDQFVSIDFTNVAGNIQSQFRIASNSADVGPYDFGSVMHYGPFTFALSGSRPVLRALDPGIPLSAIGGNASTLTPTDVLGIEAVYGSGTTAPAPTTPPTNNNSDPVATFVGLSNGATIPAVTEYGEIRVNAFDPDVGQSDGDGIASVSLFVSRNGNILGSRTENRETYDFGLSLTPGQTYVLSAVANSTGAAGGTRTVTSISVRAQ